MPLQHAVLALLADGPSYGYELKANFEKAVGPQWGGLNIGHLYQILDRLSRDEQVNSLTVPQESRPDRTVYRITSSGVRQLEEWLETPTTRTAGYRDDFILKVLAASRRSESEVHRVCEIQRTARLEELQTLRNSRRTHEHDGLATLTIEAAILHIQADLKLVDAVEKHAGEPLVELAVPTAGEIDAGEVDAGEEFTDQHVSDTGS